MDAKQELKAKESKKRILGKRLIEGERLEEVVIEHPELIFGYSKLEGDIKAFKRAKKSNLPLCEGFIPNTWNIDLPILNCKKRHYWIWSEGGNYGKTSFWKKDL